MAKQEPRQSRKRQKAEMIGFCRVRSIGKLKKKQKKKGENKMQG
jgi:hypothetical protein